MVNAEKCPVPECGWYVTEQFDVNRQADSMSTHYLAHIALSLSQLAATPTFQKVFDAVVDAGPATPAAKMKLGGKS